MEFQKKIKVNYPPISNHDDTNITVTGTIPKSKAQVIDGELIVRRGTILPNNDSTAQFIVNDTYIVTDGDAFGSLISMGRVLKERLPEEPTAAAIQSLASHGVFVESADVTSRPNFGSVKELTPVATPVVVNQDVARLIQWNSIANARAYMVYRNNRVVRTLMANETREFRYGDILIPTNFSVKAIGDNLNFGNSEMSKVVTINPTTQNEGGTL